MKTIRAGIVSRVRSSTLIEVTVSLVIITVIFSLAMMIYLNIQRSGVYASKLTAEMFLTEVYSNAVRDQEFKTKEESFGDITVFQESRSYPGANHLIELKLEARDADGKLIAEQNHLVYAPATE